MVDLQDLLVKTSRTFALSIPLLPEPTRQQVTIAYLLFRIADTFEDAWAWPRSRRIEALRRFSELLHQPRPTDTRQVVDQWLRDGPSHNEGYLELLAETPTVLEEFASLSAESRRLIGEHTVRTADGMAGFVARTSDQGHLELEDVVDLKSYCYVVAGIVGEMLTELFLLGSDTLLARAEYLRHRAARFGEALQLVNILKDSADDAKEGRCYLPPQVDRSQVFQLARQDLAAAGEYVHTLQGARSPRGYVAFTALPVHLAWATLERVEKKGAGAKLTRLEVAVIVQELNHALDAQKPALEAVGG